jgi:hypothetical protein
MNKFIKDNKITITSKKVDNNPHMTNFDGDHWKCILEYNKKRMTIYFSKGYGFEGKKPSIEEVLNCLASDSLCIENNPSFEEFANEFGYDTDSRNAKKTYTVCIKQSKKLFKFLGEVLYNILLYATERL